MYSIMRSFGLEVLEVPLAEPVERDRAAARGGQLLLERAQERRLGDPPRLELEQRIRSLALGDRRHRLADRLERDPRRLHQTGERLEQRRGEHPAEVADDRLDPAHRRRARMYIPAPSRPRLCHRNGSARSSRSPAAACGAGRPPPRRTRAAETAPPRPRRASHSSRPARTGHPPASYVVDRRGSSTGGDALRAEHRGGDDVAFVALGLARAERHQRQALVGLEPGRDGAYGLELRRGRTPRSATSAARGTRPHARRRRARTGR